MGTKLLVLTRIDDMQNDVVKNYFEALGCDVTHAKDITEFSECLKDAEAAIVDVTAFGIGVRELCLGFPKLPTVYLVGSGLASSLILEDGRFFTAQKPIKLGLLGDTLLRSVRKSRGK